MMLGRLRVDAVTRGAVLAAALLAAWAFATDLAWSKSTGDVTPLGRSSTSGAVCQAVRDYEDDLAEHPGARAWSIRCLGWDVPIGRLYRLPAADVAGWERDLAARAICQANKPQGLAGISGVERRACRDAGLKVPYVVYVGRRGRFTDIAEGFAQVADVLETGLKVTGGALPPPAAMQTQTSQAAAAIAADFGGEITGLASADRAASADAGRLMARGYVQNSEWRFDGAETDFRSLMAAADSRNASPAERARARLNLALNISNSGRFAEADPLFDSADALIAASGDQALKAEALNYRAYHLRNQRQFAGAAETAEQALAARAQARGAASFTAAAAQTARDADPHLINAVLSDALNIRPGSETDLDQDRITPEIRLLIQDAESLEIEGSSKLATNDVHGALAGLEQARAKLQLAEAQGAETAGLRARVEADVADADLASGQADAAVERYGFALKMLRTRHAGSPPEGALLMDVGRAQIAAGHADAALPTYEQAFAVFKNARGSLGASADAAEPYLDLLIDLQNKDPAHAGDYAARFFAASETVVSDATASTISRLAARIASDDEATAGLVRAVDDTRRQMSAAESRIAALQAHNAYVGDKKIAADAELAQLQGQLAAANGELLNANPRYDQLAAADTALSDLQKALRPGEAYLKTLLLGDRGYGLLITRDTAVSYAIPLGRDAAVEAAMALRAPFEAADERLDPFDVAGSYALFEAMFGPVSKQLLKARHLIYEPDSRLLSLPVSVFVTDQISVDLMRSRSGSRDQAQDYRGVAWLGDKLDSSLVLSAASFLQARTFKPSHARQLYLSFADPQLPRSDPRAYASLLREGAANLAQSEGSDRATRICGAVRRSLLKIDALPDTAKEARVVAASVGASEADVVTGAAFNDQSLRSRDDLSDYKILYFATHALLPMPDACLPEPALVTSLGPGDSDALLASSEILNLKLDAELVVLSACDTGGAGAASSSATGLAGGGEALSGLTRAFIYAGARGLIVSHWSVDSAATETLMTGLFRSRAASVAEGLQTAQAAMQADRPTSHPYYWAPFTIVGDGARPIPSGSGPSKTASLSPPTLAR